MARIAGHARTGALRVVVVCFLLSGLVRAIGLAPALAAQLSESAEQTANADSHQAASCPEPEAPDTLLTLIREREQQLDDRERSVEERLTMLTVAAEQFERQKQELIEAEERLAATLAIADDAAEDDITQITAVYENMKPKNAAEVFNAMDQEFAAGFLIRMNPQAAADILANMNPDVAYAVSLLMATRNIEAPRQ